MQATEALRLIADRLPMPKHEASRRLGRSRNFVTNTIKNSSIPRVDTLAAIAGLAGIDVCLVDRETGETLATIDVPTHTD